MIGILTFEAADITGILICIGNVFDDVKLLILLTIGVPLAFYIIKKVIEIITKNSALQNNYFEREEREYQKVFKMTKEKDVKGLEKYLEKWQAGKIKF